MRISKNLNATCHKRNQRQLQVGRKERAKQQSNEATDQQRKAGFKEGNTEATKDGRNERKKGGIGRKKRKGKGKGTKKIKKGTKEKEGASKHMHLRPCTVNVFSTLRAFWRFAHFVCE